ncbi:hypothetical protein T439DRAFT_335139 [Meredithblackwellia eburnea MCA 4105]
MAYSQDFNLQHQLVQHQQYPQLAPPPERSLTEGLGGGASDERPTDSNKEEKSYHVAGPPWWCPIKGCERSKDFTDKRKHGLQNETVGSFDKHRGNWLAHVEDMHPNEYPEVFDTCADTSQETTTTPEGKKDALDKLNNKRPNLQLEESPNLFKHESTEFSSVIFSRRRQQPHPSESSGSGSGPDSDSSESESEAPSSIGQTQQFFGTPHGFVQQDNLNTPHPDLVAVPRVNFPPGVFDGSHELVHDPAQNYFNPQDFSSSSNFGSQQFMFNTMPQQGHIVPPNFQHFQANTSAVNAFNRNPGPVFPQYSAHQEILPPVGFQRNVGATNMMLDPQPRSVSAQQASSLFGEGNLDHAALGVVPIVGEVPKTWDGYDFRHDPNTMSVPLERLNLNDPNQFQPVQRAQLHQSTQLPLDQAHLSGFHHPHHIHDANMHSGSNTQNNPGPWWAGSLGLHYHGLRRRSKRKAVLWRKWAEDQ